MKVWKIVGGSIGFVVNWAIFAPMWNLGGWGAGILRILGRFIFGRRCVDVAANRARGLVGRRSAITTPVLQKCA